MNTQDLLRLDDDQLLRACRYDSDDTLKQIGKAVETGIRSRSAGLSDIRIRLNARDMVDNPRVIEPIPVRRESVSWGDNRHHSLYCQRVAEARLVRDRIIPLAEAHEDTDCLLDVSMTSFARNILLQKAQTPPDNPHGLFRRAFGTSDFSDTLGSIAEKAALKSYDDSDEGWPYVTNQREVADFKPFDIVQGPEITSPPENIENTEIAHVAFGVGAKETGQVKRYLQHISISREALINDDTGVLTSAATAAGRAASRLVGDLVMNILNNGQTDLMADGVALFSVATHANLVASGGGAAPSSATLQTLSALMQNQVGSSSEILNIRPGYLVCPVALQSAASVLLASQVADSINPMGNIRMISDARLDGGSAVAWYLIADPAKHSGIDVYTLAGSNRRPTFERIQKRASDAMTFRLGHSVAVAATDFRSLAKNFGS